MILEVSSRKEVRPVDFAARGLALLGEAFSMAAAYALESVLSAVGEDRSMSAFKAVVDLPSVRAAAAGLI